MKTPKHVSAPEFPASPLTALVGQTPAMTALQTQIERLAAFDTVGNPYVPTVLLHGETGTGKGLTARVIHASGPRAQGPFIDVNCAAIPETLLEAELFGFEAGAFTDARRAKVGLFEAAAQGTVFLDEIDTLSRSLQSKLLTVIEEKRVRRLGAVVARPVDIKLIAATKADLRAHVAQGRFREDLYYRLAVLVLTLPPLRERPEDIEPLAQHFIRQYAHAHGLEPGHLSASARAWLRSQPWPGNVRELSHLIERVTLLRPERVVDATSLAELALADSTSPPRSATALKPSTESDDEPARIRQALQQTGGNVAGTARLLGLTRNALRYRMRRDGISRPRWADIPPSASSAPPPSVVQNETGADGSPSKGVRDPLPRWEQKPVAVLALALALSSTHDHTGPHPAPWTLVAQWQREMVEKVLEFGGVLMQRSTSLLIALFGVPRTLEYLPQRAVQTAMAIKLLQAGGRTLQAPEPELRMTVHLGEVLVDVAAQDPAAGVIGVADTLVLPVRLLGHARPGQILVSPAVAQQVESGCDLQARNLPDGEAIGVPRTVFHVAGRRGRGEPLEPVRKRALSPRVGRRQELATLSSRVQQVKSGRGQVVVITGEAGIGKSRLLLELRQALATETEAVIWYESRSAPFGHTPPLLPVVDQLQAMLGISPFDTHATMIARIEERMGDNSNLEPHIPAVRYLMSANADDATLMALEPAARQARLVDAVLALTFDEARRQALILVYEDLQWCDSGTEAFLCALMERVADVPLLLLLTHRLGYTPPFAQHSFSTTLPLQTLSDAETLTLARQILGADDLPHTLVPVLLEKTSGVPLYVEEMLKMLLETGVLQQQHGRYCFAPDLAAGRVPPTLQACIMARLDRLSEDAKRAMQLAAVIGRQCHAALLERLVPSPLEPLLAALRAAEILSLQPFDPQPVYAFKHALIQDVAYESLPTGERQALHRRVGETMETLYADRLPEHDEELAFHFTRGEAWSKALIYNERAGDRAATAFANTEAESHYTRALHAVRHLTPAPEAAVMARLHSKHGTVLEARGAYDAAAEAYHQALEQARRSDDRRREVEILVALSGVYNLMHHEAPAVSFSEHALTLAHQLGDEAYLATCLVQRAAIRSVARGQIVEATGEAEAALQVARKTGNDQSQAHSLLFLGQLLQWRADFDRSLAYLQEGLELAQRIHGVARASSAFLAFGHIAADRGAYEDALQWYGRLSDYAVQASDTRRAVVIPNLIGGIHLELFDLELALERNLEGDELAREMYPWPEPRGHALVKAGLAYLYQDDLARADACFRRATALLKDDLWMRWRWQMVLDRGRGELALAQGRYDDAWRAAGASLALATQTDSRKHQGRAQRLQGEILAAGGQLVPAARTLAAAVRLAERLRVPQDIWRGKAALGGVLRRLNRERASETQFRQATRIIDDIGAGLRTPRLRHSFLTAAPVVAIYHALGHRPPLPGSFEPPTAVP